MADVNAMTPTERAFHQECLDGCAVLAKQHKYNPTYFLQMLHEHGGVGAVRRLLQTENFQSGLTTLWEIGRLDYSSESAVLDPRWTSLFTEAEKTVARKRLKAMNYEPKFGISVRT